MPQTPTTNSFEFNQGSLGNFDWSTAANWSNDIQPANNSTAVLENGSTAGISLDDIGTLTLGTLEIGNAPLEVGGAHGIQLIVDDLQLSGTVGTSIESYNGGALTIESLAGSSTGSTVGASGTGSVTTVLGTDPGEHYVAASGGELILNPTLNAASTLGWSGGAADIALKIGGTVSAHLMGLNAGDSLELPGTVVESVVFGTASLEVVTNLGTTLFSNVAYGTVAPNDYTAALDPSTGLEKITFTVACYRRGTHIRTPEGDVRIEALKIGDKVLTVSGESRAVRWLGSRRINCLRYQDPSVIWPIRIETGALAPGVPQRDLWLSPGHSLYLDGVLIQIDKLLNGVTIVQVPQTRVEYWHLELDSHDVVLAEAAFAESYLDTGNRAAFSNAEAYLEALPDFRPKHWSETCVPLVTEGEVLMRIRAALRRRTEQLGYCITENAELHVLAEGDRIEPVKLGDGRYAFYIPPDRVTITLCARTFIPMGVDSSSSDRRELGACVARVQIDGEELTLSDSANFLQGWHALEVEEDGRCRRWTQASASLPPHARIVILDLVGRSYCWVKSAAHETRAIAASAED